MRYDLAGGLIDFLIVGFVAMLLVIDIICIAAVIASDDTDVIPKVFSTVSSVLVILFILYKPAERLMPYARNVINAILGL